MINIMLCVAIFLFSFSVVQAAPESAALEQQIVETIDNLAHLDAEERLLEQKILDLETKIRERKKILNQRTRALSYLQKFQWGALLSADEPYVMERNLKVVNRLNKFDLALFREYRASLKSLSIARSDLSATQNQLQAIITDLQTQQNELNRHEDLRRQTFIQTNEASLLKFKGELSRPLVGNPVLSFGVKPDKQNQYVLMSKGLLYKIDRGAPIKAVGPGVVIFRDRLPHWRETLIVRHDDNYYSVYAGVLEDPNGEAKNVQSRVEKGETIALTRGPELYFELRHFDSPINPSRWFKESP